jgi:hypothetical protein
VTAEAGHFLARMHWLDWMTDLVGLMLWLSWRGFGSLPVSPRPALTLLSNLRPADRTARRSAWFLPGLLILLLVRAILHHTFAPQFAEAVPWSIGAVTVVFRSDLWNRILAHSFLSGIHFTLQAYLCLALLATLHRSDAEPDSITRSIRAELGWLSRWPWGLSLLPFLVALGLLWFVISPSLVSAALTPARLSGSHALQQAVVVGLGGLTALKWPLVGLCLLRFLLDHVYLGSMPFWDYAHGTGGRLCSWLGWLPLKWGRVDLTPLAAAGVYWGLGFFLQGGLPRMFLRLPL